jgi:hypothetical protein
MNKLFNITTIIIIIIIIISIIIFPVQIKKVEKQNRIQFN